MRAIMAAALLLGAGVLAPAQAQISDDVVKIGILTDMSGVYAASTGQGSVVAAEMAVADFTASTGGKVAGKSVEVISADFQNKPDIGVALARRWYDTDKVDVILDMPGSAMALAVQQLAKEAGRMTIVSAGATSDLTGAACSPTGLHWTFDTYALSKSIAEAVVRQGGDSWFFITADYALGQALERDTSEAVKAAGGKVVGGVRHPLGAADFSSYLLQAQASGAKVVALANAGGDTANALKQATEFGLAKSGQMLVGLLTNIVDIKGVGLNAAQGLLLTEAFYWDRTDAARGFSQRFFDRQKAMPTPTQAGVYSAVLHYLKAVARTGTDAAPAVVQAMRADPVRDAFADPGTLRVDGRMVHDMYLMRVKTPADSKGPWDIYSVVATLPGDQVFRPLKDGKCPLAN